MSSKLAALALALLIAPPGCGTKRAEDAQPAFEVPCLYPRDPLAFDRIGAPCLLRTGSRASPLDLPCQIDRFVGTTDEPRSQWAFEYDEEGRLVGEHVYHLGRDAQAYRYSYATEPNALIVKRGPWLCGVDPMYPEVTTYRFDDQGQLTSVQTPSGLLKLGYEAIALRRRTQVTISSADQIYAFEVGRRGEILSRNRSGSDLHPSTLEYDYDGGRVREIVERSVKNKQLSKTTLKYEGNRLMEVVAWSYTGVQPIAEIHRFKYDCTKLPTCISTSKVAKPQDLGNKPAETMPELEQSSSEGVQWAEDLRRRVDGARASGGKPALRWDATLSGVAQRDADERKVGLTRFDPMSLHALGFRVAVRVERLGLGANTPIERDLQRFADDEIWDTLAQRSLGLGVARIAAGQKDAGRAVLVVISAQGSR